MVVLVGEFDVDESFDVLNNAGFFDVDTDTPAFGIGCS
jgi:hypothetical protein